MEIINIMKELGSIVRASTEENEKIHKIVTYISKSLNSEVILIDKSGIVTEEISKELSSISIKNQHTNKSKLDDDIMYPILNIAENRINVSLDKLYKNTIGKEYLKDTVGIFLPIKTNVEKLGMCFIYRKEKYEQEIDILCEHISSILNILIANMENKKNEQDEMSLSSVKLSIATLSYSELEAIIHIFKNIDGDEGIIVSKKIADDVGITRSIIVNALRKFESGGIVEARSLGMKGTYIKVLNSHAVKEINKFKR